MVGRPGDPLPNCRVNLIRVVAQVNIILPGSDPGKKEFTSAYSIPEKRQNNIKTRVAVVIKLNQMKIKNTRTIWLT